MSLDWQERVTGRSRLWDRWPRWPCAVSLVLVSCAVCAPVLAQPIETPTPPAAGHGGGATLVQAPSPADTRDWREILPGLTISSQVRFRAETRRNVRFDDALPDNDEDFLSTCIRRISTPDRPFPRPCPSRCGSVARRFHWASNGWYRPWSGSTRRACSTGCGSWSAQPPVGRLRAFSRGWCRWTRPAEPRLLRKLGPVRAQNLRNCRSGRRRVRPALGRLSVSPDDGRVLTRRGCGRTLPRVTARQGPPQPRPCGHRQECRPSRCCLRGRRIRTADRRCETWAPSLSRAGSRLWDP